MWWNFTCRTTGLPSIRTDILSRVLCNAMPLFFSSSRSSIENESWDSKVLHELYSTDARRNVLSSKSSSRTNGKDSAIARWWLAETCSNRKWNSHKIGEFFDFIFRFHFYIIFHKISFIHNQLTLFSSEMPVLNTFSPGKIPISFHLLSNSSTHFEHRAQ